ncbi:MAG: hypothetical protein QF916_04985 [Gammaproteobacteria bacterium]|nr:hypothetical protein [Gammaproteobacteria bacterium]
MHNKISHPAGPLSLAIGIGLIGLASHTFAQASSEILVIDVVPAGSGIDSSKLPYPIQMGQRRNCKMSEQYAWRILWANPFPASP